MSTPMQALAVGLLAAALYLPGLGVAPPYLHHDEVRFAIQAQSIAETGRDLNGRAFPVYFSEPGFTIGRDPIHVYLTALILRLRPLTDVSARLAAALAGVVAVVLLFLIARRLFTSAWIAWAAAGILALTPIHFMQSRLGLSVIYPVVFVLAWLLGMVSYIQRSRGWGLGGAALALGVGLYSYLASLLTMPVYLALSLAVVTSRRDARGALVLMGVFALALVPLAVWHMSHPKRYREIVTVYAVYDATTLGPLQGVRDLMSYFSLG